MKHGLTLIELIATIGIIILLAGFSYPNVRRNQQSRELSLAVESLVNGIKTAQNNAFYPPVGFNDHKEYSIVINNTAEPVNYQLSTAVETVALPEYVYIQEINITTQPKKISFKTVSGEIIATTPDGTNDVVIKLRTQRNSSLLKTIILNKDSGLISLQ